MDWLNYLVKQHPRISLLLPTSLSFFSFVGNLFIALSDGEIDSTELRQLLGGASVIQIILLVGIMVFINMNKIQGNAKSVKKRK